MSRREATTAAGKTRKCTGAYPSMSMIYYQSTPSITKVGNFNNTTCMWLFCMARDVRVRVHRVRAGTFGVAVWFSRESGIAWVYLDQCNLEYALLASTYKSCGVRASVRAQVPINPGIPVHVLRHLFSTWPRLDLSLNYVFHNRIPLRYSEPVSRAWWGGSWQLPFQPSDLCPDGAIQSLDTSNGQEVGTISVTWTSEFTWSFVNTWSILVCVPMNRWREQDQWICCQWSWQYLVEIKFRQYYVLHLPNTGPTQVSHSKLNIDAWWYGLALN